MAGTITHEWNGTVLTITSDSGTSSADLKGDKGDKGCRGAQGRAGIILNADGTIDMNGYATEVYVDEKIAEIDVSDQLSNYYTKYETTETIKNFIGEMDNVLPDVTTKDNGKMLMVVNGAWALVTIASAESGGY